RPLRLGDDGSAIGRCSVAHHEVSISTDDGECRSSVFTPDVGAGPWPAAIFFMDGLGIRPVLFEMAQRLADAGHVVLLPDLFYRAGPYEPLDLRAVFASSAGRAALAPFRGPPETGRAAQAARAFLAYLEH